MDKGGEQPARSAVMTYSFGGFDFDPTCGAISRPDGNQIILRPQSAEVLQYLLDRAQQVVSRDEILQAIWPNVEVTEQSITQCVSDIRRALGAGGAALLRTLPKRGYMFAMEVRQEASSTAALATPPVSEAAPIPMAQRRQVTMLFCEAVQHAISATDPEALHATLTTWHRTLAEIGERYDAHFIQYAGDGAALCFGWPAAHEHDAEHAGRAALNIVKVIEGARIGIATGIVVVGDTARTADPYIPAIAGAPLTRAARLGAAAERGTINIDNETRRLTGALFEYADAGELVVDGASAPVIRLLRESPVESRYEALRGKPYAPMIGREEELDLLQRRWRRTLSGEGHLVLISGEPGIGKSRLIAALQDSVAQSSAGYERLEWFCAPHLVESALRPVINRLGSAAGFLPDDPPQARRDRLQALLGPTDPTQAELALLAELLGIPLQQPGLFVDLPPRRKRAATLAALLRWIRVLCQQRPVLAVLEDAQWIDPTTRELLDLLIADAPKFRLLLVVTHRPEFDARAWSGLAHVTELRLARLNRRSNGALIRQVADGKALPPNVLEQIITRTDGVPLFVEELTKAVLEAGVATPSVAVPATLHASLLARLDRLAAVGNVAQTGAVIGREFGYDLLATVSELPEASLRTALEQLVQAELVYVRGEPPEAVYSFKHALVRDAAYESLLRSRRAELHASVVRALETKAADGEDVPSEILAQHCAQAGFAERAVDYFERAGQLAVSRSALVEARALFTSALDQVVLCPAGRLRDECELRLLTSLGSVLRAVVGHSTTDVGHIHVRALELWNRLGQPSRFLSVPFAYWFSCTSNGKMDHAQENAPGLVLGHFCIGALALVRGEVASARHHFSQLAADHKASETGGLSQQLGLSPKTVGGALDALAAFCAGYAETALTVNERAVDLARSDANLPNLAYVLAARTRLSIVMDDVFGVELVNGELLRLTEIQGYPVWYSQAVIHDAWLQTRRGNLAGAAERILEARREHQSTGNSVWETLHAALQADVLEASGEDEQAVRCLEEALLLASQTGVAWYVPEILRRRSRYYRRSGEDAQADTVLRQAIAAAEAGEMLQWKLRSAIELADLLHAQGRDAGARELLAPTVSWFTEGFGMADLQRATAVLGTLGSVARSWTQP